MDHSTEYSLYRKPAGAVRALRYKPLRLRGKSDAHQTTHRLPIQLTNRQGMSNWENKNGKAIPPSHSTLFFIGTNRLLPRVRLRRFSSGTGEDCIQLSQLGFGKPDFQRTKTPFELLHCARTDDRRGHNRVVQQPG